MILIVSTPRDEHTQVVAAELLKLGVRSHILDLSEFPLRLGLRMDFTDGKKSFILGCVKSGLDFSNFGSAWWRRPQQPQIGSDIIRTSHRQFAMGEIYEALQGLWLSMDSYWINDPARDQAAQHKVYQLRVAQEIGLDIPETLVTNCPDAAHDFLESHPPNQVVYKSFSATESEWRETRLVKQKERELLENVRYAPVIFQEYVDADADLRVTVVGEEIFAAAIYSQETLYKVDFRMDMGNARVEPLTLPPVVQDKLHQYMSRLGLVYGAIDMRRTPSGRYVFLEINPAGQWLFIEQKTNQKISNAVARNLASHDSR